jgi:hypothetical protein
VLHGLRAGALADACQRDLAFVPIQWRRAHLDQLVVRERALDLGNHGVGQAFPAELKNRVQGVRARLERLSLRRGQFRHGPSIRSGAHGQVEQSLAAPPRH